MAEHGDRSDRTERVGRDDDATRAMPPAEAAAPSAGEHARERQRRRRAATSVDWAKAKEQITALLAGLARWLGVIFAVILVLQVVFVIGEANPDNSIAEFMASWSESLALGFEDLFTPDDAKLRTLVNYGIAALFWLVVSAIVAKIIRRIGDSINP